MQIKCEYKSVGSWLATAELDHNLLLNGEFSTQILLEISLQNTTAKVKLWSIFEVARDCRLQRAHSLVWNLKLRAHVLSASKLSCDWSSAPSK